MVGRRNDDVNFTFPYAIDDGPQSSEDGSGLHSPTFLDRESHMEGYRADFRPIPPEITYNSVGFLPPHIAANINNIPSNASLQYNTHVPSIEYIDSYDSQQEGHTQYYHGRPPHFERDAFVGHPGKLSSAFASERFHSDELSPLEMGGSIGITNASSMGVIERKPDPISIKDESPKEVRKVPSVESSVRQNDIVKPNSRQSQARREASNVVIACQQCRSRKIRCDSTRPTCNNCFRRSNECRYDLVPKRRGPDKNPGTRQRSCKKRPVDGTLPPKKRPRIGAGIQSTVEDKSAILRETMGLRLDTSVARNGLGRALTAFTPSPLDDLSAGPFRYPLTADAVVPPISLHAPVPRMLNSRFPESRISRVQHDQGPFTLYERRSPDSTSDSDTGSRPFTSPLIPQPGDDISPSPSVLYERKMWWDDLLLRYTGRREDSVREIASEFEFLFKTSSYWLFFVNHTHFFRSLCDENERQTIQPSFVYAGLALATLLRSSEFGLGGRGRERALWLRDTAQSFLESAVNASAIDATLAEAAMLLALFEASAHPAHTIERACAALSFLDRIVRTLALTSADKGNPNVTTFSPQALPRSPTQPTPVTQCSCAPPMYLPSLGREPESSMMYKSFWDPQWTVPEVRREEIRRLCWSALTLVAGHSAHCAAFDREPLDLFLIHPDNFIILFPDERLHQLSGQSRHSPKQSIWALYCRSMLLWNGCLRLRKLGSDEQRAEYALQAYMEMDEIKDAIESHVCSIDHHLLYMAKEYLFNTQLTIIREFRRLSDYSNDPPVVKRKEAEEWILYQHRVSQRFVEDLRAPKDLSKHVLTRRPFYVWWFMSQVSLAMSLWNSNQDLLMALELAKTLYIALEFLSALWPCTAQQDRWQELKNELVTHCLEANIPPPSPIDFSQNITPNYLL